jgi:hypothetical protein
MCSPSLAPSRDPVHLVLCDFGKLGLAYAETPPILTEREVVEGILHGQYDEPVEVVAFSLKFDGIYLGRRKEDELLYAGKVEHGFTTDQQKELMARAGKLIAKTQPLTTKIAKPKAKWLKPTLLVDVEYRAMTGEGKLRHPSYKDYVRTFNHEALPSSVTLETVSGSARLAPRSIKYLSKVLRSDNAQSNHRNCHLYPDADAFGMHHCRHRRVHR